MVLWKRAREDIVGRLLRALVPRLLETVGQYLTILQQSPRRRTGAHCV